jgi:acetoacetate decarboxylase
MLHGFSVPLTPQGNSALASPPPWHYSSDCLVIEYWADPAAIAALLPPGVTPDEKSRGRAFFWFLDWQFTASNDEITDPARYQYREAFVLVEAVFEGTPINYCPYIFVDNDAAIARGWAQGFPKKLGSIYQTKSGHRRCVGGLGGADDSGRARRGHALSRAVANRARLPARHVVLGY